MNGNFGAQLIFDQIHDVLQHLDVDTYQRPLSLFSGATLGQHFRHIFEFYECLVKGVKAGQIDYARRVRNPLVEQDLTTAREAFRSLISPISSLEENHLIQIVSEYSSDTDEERMTVQSSVGRELMYAYDHAIHHLAIIRMGLQTECPEIQVHPNLGVAPSTVKYRKTMEK